MFIVDWAMKRLMGICQIKDHWSEAETERFVRLSPSICSPRSAQNDRGSWIKSIPTLFTILAEKWYRSWYYRWYRTKVSVNDCCRRDHWGIVYKSVATISELLFVFLFLAIVLFCSDSSDLLKSEFTDFYSNPLNCALTESFYGYTKLVLNKLYKL